MALVPAFSPVEQMLLSGPRALTAYPNESFGWVAAMVNPRFCDWNTTLVAITEFGVERLQQLCAMFDELVFGPVPPSPLSSDDARNAEYVDKHKRGRRAVGALRSLAAMAHLTRDVVHDAREACLAGLADQLASSTDRTDRRTRWEWAAWLKAMEANLLQLRTALHHMDAMRRRKRPTCESKEEADPKRLGAVHSSSSSPDAAQ